MINGIRLVSHENTRIWCLTGTSVLKIWSQGQHNQSAKYKNWVGVSSLPKPFQRLISQDHMKPAFPSLLSACDPVAPQPHLIRGVEVFLRGEVCTAGERGPCRKGGPCDSWAGGRCCIPNGQQPTWVQVDGEAGEWVAEVGALVLPPEAARVLWPQQDALLHPYAACSPSSPSQQPNQRLPSAPLGLLVCSALHAAGPPATLGSAHTAPSWNALSTSTPARPSLTVFLKRCHLQEPRSCRSPPSPHGPLLVPRSAFRMVTPCFVFFSFFKKFFTEI